MGYIIPRQAFKINGLRVHVPALCQSIGTRQAIHRKTGGQRGENRKWHLALGLSDFCGKLFWGLDINL